MNIKSTSFFFILLFLLSNKIAFSQNSKRDNCNFYCGSTLTSSDKENIPLVGVKTNLLYWGGFTPEMNWKQVLPNLSLELFLNRHLSVTLDGAYTSNLRNGQDYKRYAFSSFGSQIRYWPEFSHLFKGFYAGIYGNGGEFDVTPKGPDGTGHTGRHISTGLTAGYLWMFNRWLGMEIGIKGGFRHVAYDTYQGTPIHYYYEQTRYKNNVCLDGVFLNVTARFGKYKK